MRSLVGFPQWLHKTLPIGLAILLLKASCAAEPDFEESPGSCRLDCGQIKIPSNDMRIRFMVPAGTNLATQCFGTGAEGSEDYYNEMPIRFVIEKPRKVLPAERTGGPEDTVLGGTNPPPEETPSAVNWVPVSGIGFQPLLMASSMEARNADNPALDKYKGILTPEGEWCTDSCGVGSIDIKPRCHAGITNNVVLGIVSGALFGHLTVQVSQP